MAKKSRRKTSGRYFNWIGQFVHSFGVGLYFASKFLPLLLLALLIGGAYHGIQRYLYADAYFRLDVIRVRTELPFTAKEIGRLSGLRLGENLLAVDLNKVAARIERNPQIKRAVVTRILPNTIEIQVVRRFEVFQVKPKGQTHYFAIDDQGVVLPKAQATPLSDLVLIEDMDLTKKSFGIGDVYPSKNIGSFKTLYQYLAGEHEILNEKVKAITVDHLGNFTVTFASGLEMRLGKAFAKNLRKLRGLRNLLASSERDKIEYLDLQYQDVVMKMKENQKLQL